MPNGKKPKPKLSKTLTKRTKLSPSQLERASGQAGEGLASRYGADGVQSLTLTRRLNLARKKVKKFVLYSDQIGKRVYISKEIENFPLTFEKSDALKFFNGFDDPAVKVRYWNEFFPLLKFKTTHE